MDVLLVAVKKDRIADYTSVITQAGKVPALMDVDVFALQNAYEVNYGPADGTVALVNIGASVMNINVLHRGTTIFWRDVGFGGNQYTEAIQRELNLPREDAERLKLGEPGRRAHPAAGRWGSSTACPRTSRPSSRRRSTSSSRPRRWIASTG